MADPVFIGVAVLTVGAAIVALETRELIYGAIALAISMLGIAGFFLLLDAPFVAPLDRILSAARRNDAPLLHAAGPLAYNVGLYDAR